MCFYSQLWKVVFFSVEIAIGTERGLRSILMAVLLLHLVHNRVSAFSHLTNTVLLTNTKLISILKLLPLGLVLGHQIRMHLFVFVDGLRVSIVELLLWGRVVLFILRCLGMGLLKLDFSGGISLVHGALDRREGCVLRETGIKWFAGLWVLERGLRCLLREDRVMRIWLLINFLMFLHLEWENGIFFRNVSFVFRKIAVFQSVLVTFLRLVSLSKTYIILLMSRFAHEIIGLMLGSFVVDLNFIKVHLEVPLVMLKNFFVGFYIGRSIKVQRTIVHRRWFQSFFS